MGQHKNKSWNEMRHLLVTGKKIKSLYTRKKTLEKGADVSLAVKKLTEQKEFKENQVYPEAIEHDIKKEENANFYYQKSVKNSIVHLIFRSPVSLLVEVILG